MLLRHANPVTLILNEISRGGGRWVALSSLPEIERNCMLKAKQHPDGPGAGVWNLHFMAMQPNARVMLLNVQESKGKQALWVAPRSMADIEDEVVRTVQGTIMTDRGINVKRDLQVY